MCTKLLLHAWTGTRRSIIYNLTLHFCKRLLTRIERWPHGRSLGDKPTTLPATNTPRLTFRCLNFEPNNKFITFFGWITNKYEYNVCKINWSNNTMKYKHTRKWLLITRQRTFDLRLNDGTLWSISWLIDATNFSTKPKKVRQKEKDTDFTIPRKHN